MEMTTPVRIKTFRSKTLQDAIQQIRKELGPDASVLETKTSKRGFFRTAGLEVTASSAVLSDDHETNVASPPKPDDIRSVDSAQSTAEPQEPSPAIHLTLNRNAAALPQDQASSVDSSNQSLHPSSSAAPGSISRSALAPGSTTPTRVDRVCHQVRQEMLDGGLEAGIADQWLDAARTASDPSVFQDAWSLRSEIMAWVRGFVHCASPLDLDSNQPQRIAFIGPTGSGKTTTIAKLAAMLSMEHGFQVGVLQLEPRNLGPCRLLSNYADLMGWEFRMVSDVSKLSASLNELSGCRFVLVDTPGCSPSDSDALMQLEESLINLKPTSTLLVVPGTCNAHTFGRYEKCFVGLEPNSLVLTKLDESGGLGPLFSCLQSSSIPVSFLSIGQRVPTDLIPATTTRLAQHVLSFSS
jgi:flagellar biosynthesis protein FlhF